MRNHTRLFMLVVVLGFVAMLWIIAHRQVCRGWPDIRQPAQLHLMDAALELFSNESQGYPPSDANDPTGAAYCGAMKLAEAVMGKDLIGLHSI